MAIAILVLAANPQGTRQLRLNPEIREIEDALERGKYANRYILKSRGAVRVDDLQQRIQRTEARIVHFCGHGMGSQGLVLETDQGQQRFLDNEAIAELFRLFKNQIECVILNACYSEVQAQEISQHINYVIGTRRAIRDDAAIAFSKGFYEALGNGETIDRAFEFGRNRIQLEIYNYQSDEQNSRKLIPIFSEEERQWKELPEHEVLTLLIKEPPLNTIQESTSDSLMDREEIIRQPFIPKSPYKGLKRFNVRDKDLFFGRDRLIYKLIEAIEQSNLLLVLGASGSGKSSVVRAGVIPQLENLTDESYQYLLFTPNRDPFVSLHRSLLSPTLDIFNESDVEFVLEHQENTISQVCKLLKHHNSHWLIFIDQFEELFTNCAELEVRRNFIQGIIKTVQSNASSIKIVLAMRSDFLEQLSAYPRFAKIVQNNIHLVADMETNELRQVIEQPAAKHGIVFETGLVEEIIQDVRGQAGSLPLLQYTLDLLWQDDDLSDRKLKQETYLKLGGVAGALQKHINQIFNDLSPEQQIATKQVLLKLVDIVNLEQSEVLRTAVSKRASKSEFTTSIQIEMLDLLINFNLLVSNDSVLSDLEINQGSGSTVEIAHEALLSSWAELREWIEDARDTISLNNRLNEDAARWQELKQKKSPAAQEELWGGSRLEKAIESRRDGTFETTLGSLSDNANNFIDASIEYRDREQKEKVRLQTRAIKWLSAGITAALVALGFAFGQQQKAQKQSVISLTQAVEANLFLNNKLDAIIEAIEAFKQYQNIWIGRNVLTSKVLGNLGQAIHHNQNGWSEQLRLWDVNFVVFSHDGTQFATAHNDGTAKLWDVDTGEELHVLTGHDKNITSMVFSHDDTRVATASDDHTVRLWDVNTGEELRIFSGHGKEIKSVVFSPDDTQIATASDDRTARLWDVNNGKELHKLVGHKDRVANIRFSPDGTKLATASKEKKEHKDKIVRIWDVNTGKILQELAENKQEIAFIDFSPNGELLATASFDGTAKLWNVSNGKQLKEFSAPDKHWVLHVKFSPNGELLATASFDWRTNDNTTKLWDVDSGKEVKVLNGHTDRVVDIEFTPNGNHLVTASSDHTARLWNVNNGKQVNVFDGHKSYIIDVELSSDGTKLLTLSGDKMAKLWSFSFGDQVTKFSGHADKITRVKFSSDQQSLVTGSKDTTVRLWDVDTGKQLKIFSGHDQEIISVALSVDGEKLITASFDKKIKVWDVDKEELLKVFEILVHNDEEIGLNDIGFSPDGKKYVTASSDRTARLWDIDTGEQLQVFNGHNQQVMKAKFNRDGTKLVTVSIDGTARLWDIDTGETLKIFTGHDIWLNDIEFSPDESKIVTTSADRTARLWDIDTGETLKIFTGHESEVISAKFSDDGKQIVTISKDKTSRVWDIDTGRQLIKLAGYGTSLVDTRFTSNDKKVITISNDLTARLWQVGNLEELTQIGCKKVTNYLSNHPNPETRNRQICNDVN